MTTDNNTTNGTPEEGVAHPKGTCVLCGDRLTWRDIHTARPLVDGRCCRICYGTLIVPARTILSLVRPGVSRDMLTSDLRKSAMEGAMAGRRAREERW